MMMESTPVKFPSLHVYRASSDFHIVDGIRPYCSHSSAHIPYRFALSGITEEEIGIQRKGNLPTLFFENTTAFPELCPASPAIVAIDAIRLYYELPTLDLSNTPVVAGLE